MTQKTPIRDSELIVQQARRSFDDLTQFVDGIMFCLKTQGNITNITFDIVESNLRRLETQSKKIESEFYHLRNIIERNNINDAEAD